MVDTKKCSKCKQDKALTEFHKYRNGLQGVCKVCQAAQFKEQRLRNPEYFRRKGIIHRHGVSPEHYDKCMATSDKCEICESKEDLCYDHDHDTMEFRGVLCSRCNRSLGGLGDTLESVMKAVKYLMKDKHE